MYWRVISYCELYRVRFLNCIYELLQGQCPNIIKPGFQPRQYVLNTNPSAFPSFAKFCQNKLSSSESSSVSPRPFLFDSKHVQYG